MHHTRKSRSNCSRGEPEFVVVDTGGGQQNGHRTRPIQTVIRLRDGETNLLAGLIQRVHSDTVAGLPGLMDIPGLRRVLGNTSQSNSETDIIMTLTPRIIRIPDITEDDLLTLWVGTEENMRLRGASMGQGPFAGQSVELESELFSGDEETPPDGRPRQPDTDLVLERGRAGRERDAAPGAADPSPPPVPEEPPPAPAPAPGGAQSVLPGGAPGRRRTVVSRPCGPGAAARRGVRGARHLPARAGAGGRPARARARGAAASGLVLIRLVPSKTTSRSASSRVQVVVDNAQNLGSVPFHLRYKQGSAAVRTPGDRGAVHGRQHRLLASDTGGGGEIVVGSRAWAEAPEPPARVRSPSSSSRPSLGGRGIRLHRGERQGPQAKNIPAGFNTVPVAVQ